MVGAEDAREKACLAQDLEAVADSQDEPTLGGGVFLVVTTANVAAQAVLSRGGVRSNADGTATLITRPYHLLGVEAITSILTAARLGAGTGTADYRPRFDVLIRAARDLEAGTILGDDHSPEIEALIGPAAPLADGRPLPAHLANGNPLAQPVARGTVITLEMVVAPRLVTASRSRLQSFGTSTLLPLPPRSSEPPPPSGRLVTVSVMSLPLPPT